MKHSNGAENILLFSGTRPILALESNGLRVLLRLGFGEEKKTYAASYKSARAALENEGTYDFDFPKELCKRNYPRCAQCPLKQSCRYFLTNRTVA